MHVITWDNADEFSEAMRDVLLMFADIAEEGGRLTDANVWVRFDPLRFVDAVGDGKGNYGDLSLVRTGSALAILCHFYDRWEEEQPMIDEFTQPYVEAIENGRLAEFSDVADIILEALQDEKGQNLGQWFNEAVRPIYRKYVRAYFETLATTEEWKNQLLD